MSARAVAGFVALAAASLTSAAAAQTFRAAEATQAPRASVGPYEVMLRLPPDGLWAGEEMQIEFRLMDTRPSAGPQPVLFAKVRGVVDMPSMPSMPRFDEIAHREAVPGDYGVHPTFPHGGDYRLSLTLRPPGEQPPTMTPRNDSPLTFEFPLEVADAAPPNPRTRVSPVPFTLTVSSVPAAPVAGQATEIELGVRRRNLLITQPDGRLAVGDAPVEEFDLAHEKVMHLFLVRQDLGVFAHEHPTPSGPGAFRIRYVFPSAGTYRVFADVAPRNAGSQILTGEVKVAGPPPEPFNARAAFAADPGTKRMVGGITIEWSVPRPVPLKKTFVVEARLRRSDGGPLVLDPWLGSFGHLMMIHVDGQTFVHCHPDEREPIMARGTAITIPFLARFPKPGLYRGWGQFQHGGRLLTTDFLVRAGE
jgi:YtkA-like